MAQLVAALRKGPSLDIEQAVGDIKYRTRRLLNRQQVACCTVTE